MTNERFISAESVIEIIKGCRPICDYCDTLIEHIKNIPSIEVVRNTEWTAISRDEYENLVSVVRCKDCRHGEHIQIPLWENRDIDKAPSQFHDFIKCHKFHIKGFNETLFLGDDDYCSHGERREP